MRVRLFVIVAILLHSPALFAEEQNPEMDYLLEQIGESECVFMRNGSRHSAEKAEAFIERLASKSSMARKLYLRECPGEDAKPSGEWLTLGLEEFRRGRE